MVIHSPRFRRTQPQRKHSQVKATMPTLLFLSISNADLDAALQPALLTYYVIATVAMFFLAWA